jgi:hypothetical protein
MEEKIRVSKKKPGWIMAPTRFLLLETGFFDISIPGGSKITLWCGRGE